jgi:hypothetical protein
MHDNNTGEQATWGAATRDTTRGTNGNMGIGPRQHETRQHKTRRQRETHRQSDNARHTKNGRQSDSPTVRQRETPTMGDSLTTRDNRQRKTTDNARQPTTQDITPPHPCSRHPLPSSSWNRPGWLLQNRERRRGHGVPRNPDRGRRESMWAITGFE